MTIKKGLLRGIVLSAMVISLCLCLNPILQKKWFYEADSAATEIARGFYAEPENSLDVLYLGTSYIKNGISPLEIWNAYGITGYTRASAQQAPLVSYYLAKEAFKTQKPKVVVFESSTLTQSETSESNDYDKRETKLHEVIDHMKWSNVKLEMAREIVENSELSYADLLIPLYRYHDRWAELTKDDFEQDFSYQGYAYKGQFPATIVAPYTEDPEYMKKGEKREDASIDEVTADFVLRLQKLCEENGAELILLHMPNVGADDNKHNLVEKFAQTHDIPFLDYSSNELRKAIGYDSKTDSIDYGLHLNLRGAEKVAKHFGQYLASNYNFEDKRDDPAYAHWNEDYALYMEEKKAEEICQDTTFAGLLKNLEGSGFIGIFASKSDVGTNFTEEIHEAMTRLGLSADLSTSLYMSYVGITDGTNAIFEKMAGEEIFYKDKIDEKEISVVSNTRRGQNSSVSIKIDDVEEAADLNGLNIVVYSPQLDRVIISKRFNIGVNGSKPMQETPLDTLDFHEYLEEIGDFRYITALVAAKDAAMCLAPKDAALIQSMGFSINLKNDGYANPYIAVSDGGYGVLESIGEESNSCVSGNVDIGGVHVFVSSGDNGAENSKIAVNDIEYEFEDSGLMFVVYDKLLQKVVSERRFDTSIYSFTDEQLYSENTVEGFLHRALENENYTVIISAKGETEESHITALKNTLSSNGLNIHLNQDMPYIGIIDNGQIGCETNKMMNEQTYYADYKEIIVRQGLKGLKDGVLIDELNYLSEKNGIHVIVFDKNEDTVVCRKSWGA